MAFKSSIICALITASLASEAPITKFEALLSKHNPRISMLPQPQHDGIVLNADVTSPNGHHVQEGSDPVKLTELENEVLSNLEKLVESSEEQKLVDHDRGTTKSDVVNYKGWSVLKVQGFFAVIRNMKEKTPAHGEKDDLIEWAESTASLKDLEDYPLADLEEKPGVRVLQDHRQDDFYHIAVAPERRAELLRDLDARGLHVTDLNVDLGKMIEETNSISFRNELPKGEVTFDKYMTLQQIEDFILEFAAQNPLTVEHNVIGRSVEGRDIHMLIMTLGGRSSRQLTRADLRPTSVSQTVSALADLIRWSEQAEQEKRAAALKQQENFKRQAALLGPQLNRAPSSFKAETVKVFETVGFNIPYELEKYDIENSTRKTYDALQDIILTENDKSDRRVILETLDFPSQIQHTFQLLESIINNERPPWHRKSRKDTSILGVLERISKAVKNETLSNANLYDETYADILFLVHTIIPAEYVSNATIVKNVINSILIISKELPPKDTVSEESFNDIISRIDAIPGVVGVTSTGENPNTNNIFKLAQLLQVLNITEFDVNEINSVQSRECNNSASSVIDRASMKPVIFIDGGIHAREWVSPASLMYMMTQLVQDTPLLLGAEWHIVPVLNPDGYQHTWTGDRLWRKNRSRALFCRGVDLNRNFGYNFGGAGTSSRPCSEIYRGPSAFSEPESKALKSAIESVQDRLQAYVSVHSYGQMILHPWGYTDGIDHPQKSTLDSMGRGMADAIRKVSGKSYVVGAAAGVLYSAAGGSDDWASSVGAPYSFTMELRDTGVAGFVLPADQIAPTVEESWAAVKYLGDKVIGEYARSGSTTNSAPQADTPIPPAVASPPNHGFNPLTLIPGVGITAPIGPLLKPVDYSPIPYSVFQHDIAPNSPFAHLLQVTNTPHEVDPIVLYQQFVAEQFGLHPALISPPTGGSEAFQYKNPQYPLELHNYFPTASLQPLRDPFNVGSPVNHANPNSYSSQISSNINRENANPQYSSMQSGPISDVRGQFKSPFYMSAETQNYIGYNPLTGFPSFRPSVQYSTQNSFIPYSSPMVVNIQPFDHNQESSQFNSNFNNNQNTDKYDHYSSPAFLSQNPQHDFKFSNPLARYQMAPYPSGLPNNIRKPSSTPPVLVSLGSIFDRGQTSLNYDELQRSPALVGPGGPLEPIDYRRA